MKKLGDDEVFNEYQTEGFNGTTGRELYDELVTRVNQIVCLAHSIEHTFNTEVSLKHEDGTISLWLGNEEWARIEAFKEITGGKDE